MAVANLAYGTIIIAKSETYYDYNASGYVTCLKPTGARPVLKSAEKSAAVFLKSIRLSPTQLLADRKFLTLARAAVAAGKTYTSDLLEWEVKPVVVAAVAMLREGIARKAARPKAKSTGDWFAASRARVAKRHAEIVAFRTTHGSQFGAIGATSTGNFWLSRDVLVSISQTESCDWDRYSKSWHSQYGPAKTVSTGITVTRKVGLTLTRKYYPQSALRHIDRRAVEAVADALGLPKLRGKLALRIDPHVELSAVESTRRHTECYARTLAGVVIGYVAVRGGDHFHAVTISQACDGVARKRATTRLGDRRQALGLAAGIDTAQPIGAMLRGLGFCRPGVADALDILGLSDRRYDLAELFAAAKWNRLGDVAKKYPREIATLAARLSNLPTGVELPANVSRAIAAAV